jgi:predicted phosphodiesterase
MEEGKRIGLVADSHGDLEATREAIRLLKRRGAGILVHLGDFCDSILHERAAAMIGILREHGVLAVKGNNDFLVETRLAAACGPVDSAAIAVLSFLRDLPVVRALGDIRFAHSLPFDTLRAFYEPIDTGGTRRAERLFDEADFRILFCGHSHLPVRFRKEGGRVMREQVPVGRPMAMERTVRYIAVVGAAADGECALYDGAAGTCERLRIR